MKDVGKEITIYAETDLPEGLEDALLAQARGLYQRGLLLGHEAWSGSSLKGKARSYGGHYARSAGRLLQRLTQAGKDHGVKISTELVLIDSRHRRVLVAR